MSKTEKARSFVIWSVAILIGVILVVFLVVFLVATLLPAYHRPPARDKRSALLKEAIAGENELQMWLTCSLKTGPDSGLKENDTNNSGNITTEDMTNAALAAAGVCRTWIVGHATKFGSSAPNTSPFAGDGLLPGNLPLWGASPARGQVSCVQVGRTITIEAMDADGTRVYIGRVSG